MATDGDRVAEGSAEAELVAVAVCALAHLHPLCPEQASGPLCPTEKLVPARSRGTPEVKQSSRPSCCAFRPLPCC